MSSWCFNSSLVREICLRDKSELQSSQRAALSSTYHLIWTKKKCPAGKRWAQSPISSRWQHRVPCHNLHLHSCEKFTRFYSTGSHILEPAGPPLLHPACSPAMLLTGPLLGGLDQDLLHTVGRKPAHLAASAALPEAPLSDAQNWSDVGEKR